MEIPILKTRTALKNWFYNNDMVKWTLYATHYNDAKNRITTQTDESLDIDKSFDRLDKVFKDYDYYGDYYLFVTKAKDGTGGGFQTRLRFAGENGNGQNNAAVNGVNIGGLVSMEQVQGLIEGALLRKENEDLKRQIAAGLKPQSGGRFWDLVDRALEDEGSGKEVISGLGEGIKEIGTGVKYLFMNMASKNTDTAKLTKPKQQTAKTPTTEGGRKYKVDKMFSVFSQTENIFPEHEPQEVHAAIIEYFNTLGEVERGFMVKQFENFLKENKNTEGGQNE